MDEEIASLLISEKIYEKVISKSDFNKAHIAPHALKIASMFSVMSRLKASNKCDLLTKMKIYNGEDVIEKGRVKKIDIKDLRDEARDEGMKGISTRFIMKAIDNALTLFEADIMTDLGIRYEKEIAQKNSKIKLDGLPSQDGKNVQN